MIASASRDVNFGMMENRSASCDDYICLRIAKVRAFGNAPTLAKPDMSATHRHNSFGLSGASPQRSYRFVPTFPMEMLGPKMIEVRLA